MPKKICHYAGLLGEGMRDAHELGWKVEKEVEVSATEDPWQVMASEREVAQTTRVTVLLTTLGTSPQSPSSFGFAALLSARLGRPDGQGHDAEGPAELELQAGPPLQQGQDRPGDVQDRAVHAFATAL